MATPTSAANTRQVAGNHYTKQKIQHWDYVLANDIPYMEAQVIKYVSRHRDKNGVQDLEKAAHFLEKLIEVERLRSIESEYVAATAERAFVCSCPGLAGVNPDPKCRVHTP